MIKGMSKINNILYYGFIGIAVILSFIFYRSLGIFFIILGVAFDIAKPIIIYKGLKKENKVYLGLASILILFSLIASMGNFMNFTTIKTKQIITTEYNNNIKAIELQRNIVADLENSYNKLDIKDYTSNMNQHHTTNIAKVTNEFMRTKKDLQESIKKENDKLITLQNKKINKYMTIESDNNKGYHKLFTNISDQTNIDKDKILLLFSFLFAIMLESLIVIFSHICCENRIDKEITPEEIMHEALKEKSLKQAKELANNLKGEKRSTDVQSETSNKKDQVQDQLEKINQSFDKDQVQVKKIGKSNLDVKDKVLEVACEEDSQSLSFKHQDQIKSSTDLSRSTKDQKRSSSKQKIGFQSSSSKKIGFDYSDTNIAKIVKFLKDNNMQGKQFPIAKITLFMNMKRYEVDNLKPKLLEEKVIYKSNSKSYRVSENL